MKRFRVRAVRTAIVAGLALIAVIPAARPLGAREAESLLRPTPLVLKDGRIASVSIHVVPFAPGHAELGGEAEARIAELTRAVGTDCFLTAQVIGHIDSSEIAEDDTLNAHRLARSRADAVQASLIGGGLPAKAIASVWDWQFMVRAPRATLWIFQLTAGEDCEGRPLNGDLVAQATPPTARAAVPPERAATPAPAERTTKTVEASVPARTPETARPAEPTATNSKAAQIQARADTPSSTLAQPAEPERTGPAGAAVAARPALASKAPTNDGETKQAAKQPATGTAIAARPALAPKAPTNDGKTEQAAKQPATGTAVAAKPASTDKAPASQAQSAQPRQTETTVAAKPAAETKAAESDGTVERGAEGSLVITFATNSSYFPSGTTRRLRELIAGVDSGSKYQVTLQVAVSGSTKVVGARSPQEAARYNKWLAERRLERVQNWLLEHAAGNALTFKPEYVTDESRQVVVRLAPVG